MPLRPEAAIKQGAPNGIVVSAGLQHLMGHKAGRLVRWLLGVLGEVLRELAFKNRMWDACMDPCRHHSVVGRQ